MQIRELLALTRRKTERTPERKVLLTFKGDSLAYGGICCAVGPDTKKVDVFLMQEILHDLNKRKLASVDLEIAQPGDEGAFLVKWMPSGD